MQRLQNRCEILAKTILQIKPLYMDCEDESQKAFLETLIGAGIWYLGKGVWTNKISTNVVKSFHPDSGEIEPKYTEDHEYPRKVAARELLQMDWKNFDNKTDKLIQLFKDKYGRVNYVTKNENSRLTKFQKVDVFISPKLAYQNANVQLINITNEQLMEIKQRNIAVINKLSDVNPI